MKIGIMLISSLMLMSVLGISGCLDNRHDEPCNDVPEGDVDVNDIWIWFVVEWKEAIEESYVIIPTLIFENGTFIHPKHEWEAENYHGDPVSNSDNNFTIVDSDHGKAIRYDLKAADFWEEGGPYRSIFRLPVILGDADITFNTMDEMDIGDRFFKGGPAFSIWEENDGKVTTWTYVDDEANWVRLYLERGGDMDHDHTWGNFDCYKGITHETNGKGWFNIELERRTSFPID